MEKVLGRSRNKSTQQASVAACFVPCYHSVSVCVCVCLSCVELHSVSVCANALFTVILWTFKLVFLFIFLFFPFIWSHFSFSLFVGAMQWFCHHLSRFLFVWSGCHGDGDVFGSLRHLRWSPWVILGPYQGLSDSFVTCLQTVCMFFCVCFFTIHSNVSEVLFSLY